MNQHSSLCPMCDEGQLVEHIHERQEEIDGYAFVIRGLAHSICDRCGEYITTPDQSRRNKQTIIEARQQAVAERDRAQRLTAADILRLRKKMGITQAQAARVFGGGPNAFSKYEHGDVAPSDGMEKLLRLADSVPEAANWLLRRAGLPAYQTVEPPCGHTKSCVFLKRILNGSIRASWPTVGVSDAAKLAMPHISHTRNVSFAYTESTAANDSPSTPVPDLQVRAG